jgi:hypothetical protein
MKTNTTIAKLVLGIAPWMATGLANAAITFEDAAVSIGVSANALQSNGFVFSTGTLHGIQTRADLGASNGSHYLTYLASGSETFSALSNTAFNLSSLDLGGWYNFGTASQFLTLTGYQTNGSSVSATLEVAPNAFQTYALTGFTNLHHVRLGSVDRSPSYVAIDNLVTTPVPEPETFAMLLLGLGVLGALQRKKRGAGA